MNTNQAFKFFPDATELWEIDRQAFMNEADALAHAKHFNLGKPTKVARPVETTDKAEAEQKAAAEEKAAAEPAETEEKAHKKGK